jgi:hypothetical protein
MSMTHHISNQDTDHLVSQLGKDIGKLFIGSYMRNNDSPLDCMISQEMVLDVYVFGSKMLTWVISNLDGTLIVT